MYIIKTDATENGARPALQTWNGATAPEGYALCPDEFYPIFYSASPAGFVNVQILEGMVMAMEVNQEALDAYVASLPEEVEVEEQPTEMEQLRADVDYIAVMTGVELV